MTQPRSKDGKFAKKEEYNPDHDPATKGYVKCLLRKTRDHTHVQVRAGNWVDVCAIGGWTTLALVYVLQHTGSAPFPAEWWAAIAMFSVACTAMAIDKCEDENENTGSPDPSEPKCIREYKAPSCSERYNMQIAMEEWEEARKKRKCE
jgi:hypothetical protein